MSTDLPVRRALVAVADKEGLVPFARGLVEAGVELVSTGNTARARAASASSQLLYDISFPWSTSAPPRGPEPSPAAYRAARWWGFSPYRRDASFLKEGVSAGGSSFSSASGPIPDAPRSHAPIAPS